MPQLRHAVARNAFAAALVALVAAVVLALATRAEAAGGPPAIALTVTYWEVGASPETKITWTLRCDPPSGSLPRRTSACTRLAVAGPRAFRPVPKGVACTQIYGGPQVARVTGLVGGQRVWARFSRENGCQIARWDRLVRLGLLPG